MNPRALALSLYAFVSTCAVSAQSGRTLTLAMPATLGGTARIVIDHPASAGGNYYQTLVSAATAAVQDLGLPNLIGLVRIDLRTHYTAHSGFLANGGATSTSSFVPVPNSTALLGLLLDVQSADVSSAMNVYLSDNEVRLRLVTSICNITMVTSDTNLPWFTTNNVAYRIDDSSIGSPTNIGLAPFTYRPIGHRGQEGFVEGYAGSPGAASLSSDIDSLSARRVALHTYNSGYQVIRLPNGYDIAIVQDQANTRQFSVLSYHRATGRFVTVPGTTVFDNRANPPFWKIEPYMAFSNDGSWACVVVVDPAAADRVLAFRTDGSQQAVDITAINPVSTRYIDGAQYFTRDFIIVAGSGGYYWTSATAPTVLQPLTVPSIAATNNPPDVVSPFSWRVSRDAGTAYFPIAFGNRGESDVVQLTSSAGIPRLVNFTSYSTPTGLAEFGFSGTTPSIDSDSTFGIKAAVSPDGSKIALLAATTTRSDFPGVFVATGSPNPPLITVAGATYYSELTFLNDRTVLFFAGANSTSQDLYKYDVNLATVTRMTNSGDIRTRGQFWSLGKRWWYFVRSNAASDRNNIIGVDAMTGLMKDVTGNEFSAPSVPPRHVLRTGSLDITTDPRAAVEMQLRRAPIGDFAYFTARRETGISGLFEDANAFRFDIESCGQAEMLTGNLSTGYSGAVKNMRSLAISADARHLAWAQRIDPNYSSEDVFHLSTSVQQVSISRPSGQTVTAGSIHFTCNPPNGIVYSIGTGSSTVPSANTRIEWVGFGTNTPINISGPPAVTRIYQVIGTFD